MRHVHIVALIAAGLACTLVATTGFAESQDRIDGQYRVYQYDGTHYEGHVTEKPNGTYEVKTKRGFIITVRKNQVKELVPLEEVEDWKISFGPHSVQAPLSPLRREISEEEIQEFVSGITVDLDPEFTGASEEDMMGELPLDVDSLKDMLRKASMTWEEGVPPEEQDNVLIRPHFVMVCTADPESARALGSRLERVWAWNVKYLEMLDLPAVRPDHKLELFYFATQDELMKYSLSQGSQTSPGVLGYYSPSWNRSHFFDMWTFAGFQGDVRKLEDPNTPWRERQRTKNELKRKVEFYNIEVIQHEIGHHIHFNVGLFSRDAFGGHTVPVWLVEGTTMMFEVPPSEMGGSLGLMNHNRLFQLRQIFGNEPLNPDTLKMFMMNNALWYGGGGWGVGQSYCLGWSLVYYLYKERREELGAFCRRVFGRDTEMTISEVEADLVDCFGELDEEWFEDYYDFMNDLVLRPSLVEPDSEDSARQQNIARHRDRSLRGGFSKPDSDRRPPGRGRGR